MRRATSSALQFALAVARRRRRAPTESVPSGLGVRGQMWPLSMMGVAVDEARPDHAVRRDRCVGSRLSADRGGAMLLDRAVGDDDVGGGKSVAVAVDAATPRRARPARVAFVEHDSAASSGRPRSRYRASVLPPDGALVPLPQKQMRDRLVATKISDAGQREQHQRREEARDVQPVLRFDQAEGEAGPRPPCPPRTRRRRRRSAPARRRSGGRRGNRAGRSAASDRAASASGWRRRARRG